MFAQNGSEAAALPANPIDRIVELPVLVLNVHSRCNCRCVMCDIWKREGSSELRAIDLQRHRESLRRLAVRWVVLSGGEPLLHSDLRALCAFFRELHIRLTLLTTGLLLTKRAAEVAEWFDDVVVSLDGPAAIHDAIRRVSGAFQLIQSGVANIHQLRPGMKIAARTTVQKANHLHLRETVVGAKTIRLDGISFLAADLTSEAFNRSLPWPVARQNEIGLTAIEVQALEDEIEELIANHAQEIRSGYIAENASKLRRIVNHFKAHLGHARHQSPACNAPWVSAVIETDGSVRPCFFHRAVGNIHEADFKEIVNGDKARAFRDSLNIDENPICQRCVCSLNSSHPGGSEVTRESG
jgi:MoaA/NifB/PqqE/SkfB family radical SAM enzyme